VLGKSHCFGKRKKKKKSKDSNLLREERFCKDYSLLQSSGQHLRKKEYLIKKLTIYVHYYVFMNICFC
jgi:phage terminase small subunit